jgi:glycosyltransferase involved in cell wall biosynthesis
MSEPEGCTASSEEPQVSPSNARVLIVLPCYNEARSIASVLDEIASLPVRYHTLVVDDGSTDRTWAVASRKSRTVRLPLNLGIGGCVQTGIRYAEAHGYDFCVQVDGDGQHPPAEIERLLEAMQQTRANVLVGSRFRGLDSFRSTRMRRFGIGVISLCIRATFGQHITDPTSGFRMLDKKAIKLFAQEYPRDFPEPISLAMALRNGLTVQETCVPMRERQSGRSSIVGVRTAAYVLRVLSYIVLTRIGKRERHERV